MSNSIISIKNLEKTFLGAGEPLTILKDLDMEVEEGSKSIIIGASGSGKSTLLNIIGGLESSTKGDIFVGPYEISKLNRSIQKSINALKAAEFLESHENVSWVNYPKLKSSPYYELSEAFFKNATYLVDKYHYVRQIIWAFERTRKRIL